MFIFLVIQLFLLLLILLWMRWWLKLLYVRKVLKWLPSAPRVPILGSALEFGDNTATIADIHRLTNNHDKSCYLESMRTYEIFTKNYDLLEFVLSSNTLVEKGIDYSFFHCWLGTGLLTAPALKWKQRRRILTPAFHFSILQKFTQTFNSNAEIMIRNLNNDLQDDEVVDIYLYVTKCALDIITESAMGVSIHSQKNRNIKYVEAVKEMCRIVVDRVFSVYKGFAALYIFSSDYRKEKKTLKILHDFSNSVISTKIKQLQKTDPSNEIEESNEYQKTKPKLAFLDLLLSYSAKGSALSQEDIREEVDTFMFEGHDTVTSAISFTLYLLANHPDHQKLARNEQKELFGAECNREATYQDLLKMKYLEMVIKESLRLYPPVPMISRTIHQDVDYKGHIIPKGTVITLFIYGINRDPEYFQSPEEFIPERFQDLSGKNPFAYLPFSAGPRNCIGQKFAMLEMKSVISKIIRNYELMPTNPPHKLKLAAEAVMKSHNGVKIKLKPYKW